MDNFFFWVCFYDLFWLFVLVELLKDHVINGLIIVHALIIVVGDALSLGAILSHTSDDAVLDLGPLASDIWRLVVVTGACWCGDWVRDHIEHLVVFHFLAALVCEGCGSLVGLGLGPAEEDVGEVVLILWAATSLFLLAESISSFDRFWLPLVAVILLSLALNFSGWPNIFMSVYAVEMAKVFLATLLWFTVALHLFWTRRIVDDVDESTLEVTACGVRIEEDVETGGDCG